MGMIYCTVDTSGMKRFAASVPKAGTRAERILAEQVRKDTRPFVPMRNGMLDSRTMIEGNVIIYRGPSARYLYHGKVMVDPDTGSPFAARGATKVLTDKDLVFTTDFHSQAQAYWCEASKAQNLSKWERVSAKAIKEGLNE